MVGGDHEPGALVIARASGALTLVDAGVTPQTTERDARGAGWAETGAPGVLVREGVDVRGRPLVVALRFVGGRLASAELRYAIRRPAEDEHGQLDWESARKDLHDAICREWFASTVHDLLYAPPPQPGPLHFRFPWGDVRSDRAESGRGAAIEVRYAGEPS